MNFEPGDKVIVKNIDEYMDMLGTVIDVVMCRYHDKYDSFAECPMVEIQFHNKKVFLPKDMLIHNTRADAAKGDK